MHKANLLLDNEHSLSSFTPEQYSLLNKAFKKCPSGVRTAYFKTLINSWATSSRMQEGSVLPCVFGCDEVKVDLRHYLVCPVLWTLACSCASLPAACLESSPLERLCLLNPEPWRIQFISAVSR